MSRDPIWGSFQNPLYPTQKDKRQYVRDWKWIKKIRGNKCIICGRPEEKVGKLVKAHIKAHSKKGQHVEPMCQNCHWKYDNGKLTSKQLKKLNLTRKEYLRLIPKKKRKSKSKNALTNFGIKPISARDLLG